MNLEHFVMANESFLKLGLSLILGFAIGLERELTNKSAGLRTHILVCMGSTVFTILSIYGFPKYLNATGMMVNSDPARVAAQILAGVGFIGGGAVLRHGITVHGLTTAATLWIVASIGMAVGTGSYQISIYTTMLCFSVLVLIRYLEVHVLSKFTRRGARIKATVICPVEFASEIEDWFYTEFPNKILEMNCSKIARDDNLRKLSFIFDFYCNDPLNKVNSKFKNLNFVESITVQQIMEDV